MILQLTLTRFIQVYIVQGTIGAIFSYIAYLILKRDKKRLNVTFAGFYISAAIGIFLNFVYAPLTDEVAVLWLNFFTNYFIALATIFIVVFDLILLKSEKVINNTKQLIIILIYAAALLGLLFFIISPDPGVKINAKTNWKPVYELPYYIYFMIILNGFCVIPSILLSIVIYTKFEDDLLKKKWRYFMLGLIIIHTFMVGTFTMNYLNDETLRTIWALLSLFLSTVGPILMYYGVGRQIQK
ncbi:MAG: hypothetical protein ACP6IY_05490 [Promethearchaeia archaeon]